jgi:hypothetical protein
MAGEKWLMAAADSVYLRSRSLGKVDQIRYRLAGLDEACLS